MAIRSVTAGVGPVDMTQHRSSIATGESPKVIVLEEMIVEGRVQKPEAFYILQRSNLNYNALEPKKSFVPKILDSIKREPL